MKKLKAKFVAWLLSQMGQLIYTSKGNVPVSCLELKTEWSFTERGVRFREIYLLDGEIVKESPHIFILPIGSTFKIEQGSIG